MKTIIYSQKQHADYVYSGSYTNGPYLQSVNVPPRKSNNTKKLQSATSSNKNSKEIHLHQITNEQKNHTNLQIPSPHINKAKKPTQKPVQNHSQNPMVQYFIKEYQKIINNLQTYEQYYEFKLKRQMDLHNDYFKKLIKIVEEEHLKSLQFLKNQFQSLTEKMQLQQGVLCNKIAVLREKNLKPYQKEFQQLKGQQSLQIPLFQVRLIPFDKFKDKISDFTFVITTAEELEKEMNQSRILSQTICLQDSVKKQKKEGASNQEISAQEIEQMTPIHKAQEVVQVDRVPVNLQDKDLYCDEDIQNILKENKIVRKKRYQWRQEPIPEESESHQDSGIISQNDTLNQSYAQ